MKREDWNKVYLAQDRMLEALCLNNEIILGGGTAIRRSGFFSTLF